MVKNQKGLKWYFVEIFPKRASLFLPVSPSIKRCLADQEAKKLMEFSPEISYLCLCICINIYVFVYLLILISVYLCICHLLNGAWRTKMGGRLKS